MIKTLKTVITNLSYYLANRSAWKSVFIDYEKPHVERIWASFHIAGTPLDQKHRIYLHKIHPCKTEETFFHPHPWPSAMLICEGSYETGVGFGDPNGEAPHKMGPFYLRQWTAYQMIDPREWHYVRPLQPCMTIMVTGEPFANPIKNQKEKPKHRELTRQEFNPIFDYFSDMKIRSQMLTAINSCLDE